MQPYEDQLLFFRQNNYDQLVNDCRRRDNVSQNSFQGKEELGLTPALRRGKLLSTGKDPQLVGEVEFVAATVAAIFTAVAVAADCSIFTAIRAAVDSPK